MNVNKWYFNKTTRNLLSAENAFAFVKYINQSDTQLLANRTALLF